MKNKKKTKNEKTKNEKIKNKEVVLRSTKMKFFNYSAYLESLNANQQSIPNFIPPYKPEYPSFQHAHHWRMLDEDDNCFRITNEQNSRTMYGERYTSYDVEILRDIELYHDVSIPGRWGGNIKVTINKNWGISMSFSTPDGWVQRNQYVYGFLNFSSGDDTSREGIAAASTMYGSCCGVKGDVYSRNLFFYSDLPYDNLNYREATGVDLKPFRIGNGPNNVYQQINTPNLSSSTKRLGGVNPPVKDRDVGYLNEPVTNSICVLRYKAYIQGYYGSEPTNNMIIVVSGNLNVKLPGYKIQTPGERYHYVNYLVPPPDPPPPKRNGDGIVFHHSDCGYPNVRMYSFGGDGPGSACSGIWLQNINVYQGEVATNIDGNVPSGYTGIKVDLSYTDLVWYGPPPSESYIRTKAASNKYYNRPQRDWNWSAGEFAGLDYS